MKKFLNEKKSIDLVVLVLSKSTSAAVNAELVMINSLESFHVLSIPSALNFAAIICDEIHSP